MREHNSNTAPDRADLADFEPADLSEMEPADLSELQPADLADLERKGARQPSRAAAASPIAGAPTLLVQEDDVAKMLGVSAATWRRWYNAGQTPEAIRKGTGKRLGKYWPRAVIIAWVEEGMPDRPTWEAILERGRRGLPAGRR